MSAVLLAGIAGLALLDSLNPATILAITLILLTVPARTVPSAVGFVAGAIVTVFVLGAVIFVSAGAAASVASDSLSWLRRAVFLIAAVTLLVAAVRRLKDRQRAGVALPGWFSPRTAFPLGVLMTGADLPNAFPYFIAIERMASAGVGTATGLLVLAGYSLIYCVPCLILLALGIAHGPGVRRRLQRVHDKFSTGTAKRSVTMAILLFLLAVAVGAVAVTP